MRVIVLETYIAAPIEICFDAARSVDLHLHAAEGTEERVVAGRTSGLCKLGDEITWQARHFGILQRLSIRITKMEAPHFFVDEMTRGAFKSMRHEHYFRSDSHGTRMCDKFMYEAPFGIAGVIFDALLLHRHMHQFLVERNHFLKLFCEKVK